MQSPFAFYQRARALGDFVFWEDYKLPMAVTHEAVQKVLKHRDLGRMDPEASDQNPNADLADFYEIERYSFLDLEPPDHTRIKRVAAQGFSRERVAALAPEFSQIADRLIDAFPTEPFDLLSAYFRPLASEFAAHFLGIDPQHAHKMQRWSDRMVAMYQARRDAKIEAEAAAAATAFSAFIRKEIANPKHMISGTILNDLFEGKKNGLISEEELISTVILILNAGHEATVQALANAFVLLDGQTERTLMLRPENIADTVEECLRFAPPLHLFRRHVYADVTILGVEFKKGDVVGCLLGSACRDDAVWPDGEKFDPFRLHRKHTAFGSGIHVCIGASMARLELQIGLPALFSRCPSIRLVEPPRMADMYHFHGPEKLMVEAK